MPLIHYVYDKGNAADLTSKDLFNLLNNAYADISNDYNGKGLEKYHQEYKVKMTDELYCLTGDSIVILDLYITDCVNGILTLRYGYTTESLADLLGEIIERKEIFKQKLNNIKINDQNVKNFVADVITCLGHLDRIQSGHLERLKKLMKNSCPQGLKEMAELNETIRYVYNYQEEKGTLTIKGFNPITLEGRRALILNFFYINRLSEKYFNHTDFNNYIINAGLKLVNLSSNDFSHDITAMNERIKKETGQKITKIIMVKKIKKYDKVDYNYYKFIGYI